MTRHASFTGPSSARTTHPTSSPSTSWKRAGLIALFVLIAPMAWMGWSGCTPDPTNEPAQEGQAKTDAAPDTPSTPPDDRTSPDDSSPTDDAPDASEPSVQPDDPPQDRSQPPETTPTAGFALVQSGKPLADQSTYNIPLGITNPSSAAVAIFSEQKDSMVIQNNGDSEIVIKSITIKVAAGVKDEEFRACSGDSGVNTCKPMTLPTLKKSERFDFYLHFYPISSGKREATLQIEYTDDAGDHTHSLNVIGYGRIASDKLKAILATKATLQRHKLWGGFNRNQDEAPGSLVADSKGNLYFAGVGTAHVGTSTSDRNIFVAQIKADGTQGWARIYHSSHHDELGRTGDNGGLGATDALTIDDKDNLYLAAKASNGNNKTIMMVAKIDTSDGSAAWTKYWFGNTERLRYTDAAEGFAIDVKGDLVFVTGVGKADTSSRGIAVVALGTDGSLKWSRLLVPQGKGSNAHRGHAIRADGKGNLYVAGIDYSSGAAGPFLAKLEGIDASGSNVKLAWARTVSGETQGSNFNSMALDKDGNIYVATDRRGATTYFSVIKFDPTGKVDAATTLPGSAGDRNNIYTVRVEGDSVYVGGRIGLPGWDSLQGDGLIAQLATADLSIKWAGVYYTGTGANELCSHIAMGFAVANGQLHVMGQVYTGNKNFYRYWGYWYDFPQQAASYRPSASDTTSSTTLLAMPKAGLVKSGDTSFSNDGKWSDIPQSKNIEFQDASDKNDQSNGSATDGDVFLMTLKLQ